MSTKIHPSVWIILVNWNGRVVTLDCLQSLQAVTYPNRQVLVVDNGSSDGSIDAIQAAYPEVHLLAMGRNLRFAGGSNAGMTFALEHKAELLLLLNNDTLVDAGFLEPLVARLSTDPDIGMVTPKIYYHSDPARIWYAGGRVSMWTGTMRHIGIRETDRGQYDVATQTGYASGCCILTSREVVDQIGMLDESYAIYTEDADWCMRAQMAGRAVVYEPRSMVWHKISVSTGGHLSLFKMKNKFLGNLRFFRRYAQWYHWLVFPWMNLLVNSRSALLYISATQIRKKQ